MVCVQTLAFVLPLLRHAKAQPPPEVGKGPIGLILGPTRELAVQIYSECRRFARAVDLRVVCVYGGSGVAEQIAALKRGSDVIVATPGRLIDMLCANHGRVLQLDRVSYVVLDEADRMFDLGFEPQIAKILELVRPDRQLVMFSATFPPSVEKLARKTLKDGIEIVIGGRSVASNSITQVVEVRKEEDKFPRLLEILGKWYPAGAHSRLLTMHAPSVVCASRSHLLSLPWCLPAGIRRAPSSSSWTGRRSEHARTPSMQRCGA